MARISDARVSCSPDGLVSRGSGEAVVPPAPLEVKDAVVVGIPKGAATGLQALRVEQLGWQRPGARVQDAHVAQLVRTWRAGRRGRSAQRVQPRVQP